MKNNSAYYKKRLKPIPKYVLVIVLSIVFFSPFLIMVTTALKTNADAFQLPVRLFPREIIWNNFPEAMAKIPYVRYMMNTIFITLLSVVGQMVATPLVAYSLAKIKWKGAPIISALIMGTMMIPYTVTMIPLYKIWSRLGFTNTYVPLILPTFFGSPFYIIIMRQFFAGLPNSLMEAAKIDHCTSAFKTCADNRRYLCVYQCLVRLPGTAHLYQQDRKTDAVLRPSGFSKPVLG